MSLPFKDRLRKVSLIFACGTALFSDGYANGILSDVNTLLNRIYGAENVNANSYGTTVRSVAFAGTVVGMMIFGYLSDKVGRKFGMMAATSIVALFSGLSAASSGAHGSLGGLLAMLSVMRFLLGIGIGADYPCGSVSASEQSEQEGIHKRAQHRWLTLATNNMICFGIVVANFVPLVLVWMCVIFCVARLRLDQTVNRCGENHLRAVWRLSLGLGAVPALLVFFWRLNMEEPERFRKDSMKYAKIPYSLVIKKYWGPLATISFIWFLYDFIVYPFGIYSSTIVDNVTGGADSLTVVFGWNVVINLLNIPGTLIGAFVIDYLGPKYTLILGLVAQGVTGFLMSGLYKQLTNHIAAFVVVYGIFQALGAFGPGNCTIVLASKSSPTAVRGQFYGVAAATAKVGAFVGTWAFPPMIDAFGGPKSLRGNTGPFWVGSGKALSVKFYFGEGLDWRIGLAFLSAIVALLFLGPINADGMRKLDQEFREYLEENGYDTSQMGLAGSQQESVVSVEGEKFEEKT